MKPSSCVRRSFIRVRHEIFPSPFLFNFVIDTITQTVLSLCENGDMFWRRKLSDLGYADDVMLLSEDTGKS